MVNESGIEIFFEDLKEGQSYNLGNYHVSREEILEFATKYDPQPFHLSEEGGNASQFGGLIASGWHATSIFMKLYVDGFLCRTSSQGSQGADMLRWKRPIRPGDILTGNFTIMECLKFRSDIGVARGRAELFNQDKKLVMSFIGNGMFKRRTPTS